LFGASAISEAEADQTLVAELVAQAQETPTGEPVAEEQVAEDGEPTTGPTPTLSSTAEPVAEEPVEEQAPTTGPTDVPTSGVTIVVVEPTSTEEPPAEESGAMNAVGECMLANQTLNVWDNSLESTDLRKEVDNGGDITVTCIIFLEDVDHLVIGRAVPDDGFKRFDLFTAEGSTDLLPHLNVRYLDEFEGDDYRLSYMAAVGVDLSGEDLPQNGNSVVLNVKKGDFLLIVMKDDPKLGVNSGGLIVLGPDSFPFTLDVNGNPVEPTYWLENDPNRPQG